MNLLWVAEIQADFAIPDFGPAFDAHIAAKHHPDVRAASITAWHLLKIALESLDANSLPQVQFTETGKPFFPDSPLHFSLSHSGRMAAALLSDKPCAVDVEAVKPNVRDKLIDRCLNEQEKALGCDFFECWTKKECMGKLSGKGLPFRPAELDSLNPEYADHFHLQRFTDANGTEYALCALCMNNEKLQSQKIRPEAL